MNDDPELGAKIGPPTPRAEPPPLKPVDALHLADIDDGRPSRTADDARPPSLRLATP